MRRRRLAGELESVVLGALWAAGEPLTAAQVLDAIDIDLAYTTVMTTLARLHDKGSVRRQRVGRAYAYMPSAEVAADAARQMRRVLDRGDHATVLANFVGTLDDDDERLLSDLLRSRRRTQS
jgi:predicted transcriptional regulator